MRIEPGHISQVLSAWDGEMVLVDADVGGVAADLKAIDPCLKVRFASAANPPCWIVFWESEDGRDTYLVTSAKAYRNASGTWEGLDQRLVEQIRSIDPQGRSGYNYGRELERINRQAMENARKKRRVMLEELAEHAAHAVRKDLGADYKGRVFLPRDVSA